VRFGFEKLMLMAGYYLACLGSLCGSGRDAWNCSLKEAA